MQAFYEIATAACDGSHCGRAGVYHFTFENILSCLTKEINSCEYYRSTHLDKGGSKYTCYFNGRKNLSSVQQLTCFINWNAVRNACMCFVFYCMVHWWSWTFGKHIFYESILHVASTSLNLHSSYLPAGGNLQKEVSLYESQCENEPTSHLIYELS